MNVKVYMHDVILSLLHNLRYHFILGVVTDGGVKVCKISTHDNLADMPTKFVSGANKLC